jgi:ATPase subunit of ABC transporter with duplicated ATPase domains
LSEYSRSKYLGDLGLASQFHKVQYASLSGGQRSRVSLARLMVSNPDFLLFDEVTNHLDIDTCSALTQAINNFKGPVIMISHNLDFITSTNCKVYELSDSELVETTIEKYQDKIWASLE